jgi:hypothetical protein
MQLIFFKKQKKREREREREREGTKKRKKALIEPDVDHICFEFESDGK